MRKSGHRLRLPLLITCALATSFAPAETAAVRPERLNGLLESLDSVDRPGCAFGVAHEGQLILRTARGASDPEARTPLAADAVFNVGSISKQFTAFAILLLEQRGMISLDDSVRKYVPELAGYAEKVTLRHLLHHTGGLRDYVALLLLERRSYQERSTKDDALEVLSRQAAGNAPPGLQYEYSNTGYFLLGVVVERVTGNTLAEFMKTNVFDPLGMRDTVVVDRYPPSIPRLVPGFDENSGSFERARTVWEHTGDGQVHTSVADLVRWETNLRQGIVGGRGMFREMRVPGRLSSGEPVAYGAGLALGTYRGLNSVRHGGDWAGYAAHVRFFPENGFAFFALCNRSDVPASDYTAGLADLYLAASFAGADVKDAPDEAMHAAALRGLTGRTDLARMPPGLYRNEVTARHVELEVRDFAARVGYDGEFFRPAEVEPGIYRLGEPGDTLLASLAPSGGSPASLVIRDSPQSQTYRHVQRWRPAAYGVYAGSYASPETPALFTIEIGNHGLELVSATRRLPLAPLSENVFTGIGLPEASDEFNLRFDAGAREFRMFLDGAGGLLFHRVAAGASRVQRDAGLRRGRFNQR